MPSLVELLAGELAKLPIDVIQRVIDLIRSIASSDDPKATAERAALSAAGEAASEAALKEILR